MGYGGYSLTCAHFRALLPTKVIMPTKIDPAFMRASVVAVHAFKGTSVPRDTALDDVLFAIVCLAARDIAPSMDDRTRLNTLRVLAIDARQRAPGCIAA
jgi:hypothetical protein